MQSLIAGLAVFSIGFGALAYGQVTQWTDDHGIVHYESIGPRAGAVRDPPRPKPNALRAIERDHAGLRLGDDESSFVAAKRGYVVGTSGTDGNYYRCTGPVPEGVISMGALFSGGRLALIAIEYRDFGLRAWQQLKDTTAKKYGAPFGDSESLSWNDGVTEIALKLEPSERITATLEDFAAMARYSEEQRAALPKF